MDTDYFLAKFTDTTGDPRKLCDAEELSYLICLTGTHMSAICDGQLDYNALGTTANHRMVGWLLKMKEL